MALSKNFIKTLCLFTFTCLSNAVVAHNQNANVLYYPSGKYAVSFINLHWLNSAICPDPTAPNNASQYLLKNNTKSCREIMVRVYYPTNKTKDITSRYLGTPLASIKNSLTDIKTKNLHNDITKTIATLNKIKLPVKPNLPIADATFPVIIFSPGANDNSDEYTSILINLTSHGYIPIVPENANF